MTKDALISVIVPVYNVENYLRFCLDSIVNQSYQNLQIILVNDGSTDESGKICDEYARHDSRIDVIHQNNHGPSSARNVGLDHAKGNFIGFVDSDDVIHPKMYEDLLSAFEMHRDCQISISRFKFVERYEMFPSLQYKEHSLLSGDMLIEGCFNNVGRERTEMSSIINKLYSNSVIRDIRFSGKTLGEDYEFNIQVFKRTELCVMLSGDYFHHLVRNGSLGRTACGYNTDGIDALFYCLSIMPVYLKTARYNCIVKQLFNIFVFRQQNKDWKSGNKWIRMLWKENLIKEFLSYRDVGVTYKLKMLILLFVPGVYSWCSK